MRYSKLYSSITSHRMKTSLCGHNYTNFAHSIGLLLLETYFPGKTSQQSIDVLCHRPCMRKAWAYIFAFPSTTETFGQVGIGGNGLRATGGWRAFGGGL